MAKVIITFDINLEPEANIEKTKEVISEKISNFGGEVGKSEVNEVAFGIKCLKLVFILDEDTGSTEELEKDIEELEEVSSVKVSDVRRALG